MRLQLAPSTFASHRLRSSGRTSGRSMGDLCSAKLYSGSSFSASGKISCTCRWGAARVRVHVHSHKAVVHTTLADPVKAITRGNLVHVCWCSIFCSLNADNTCTFEACLFDELQAPLQLSCSCLALPDNCGR